MKQQILRDGSTGRILGRLGSDQWFSQDDIHWKDKKIKASDIRFPEHDDYQSSPVTITYLNDK